MKYMLDFILLQDFHWRWVFLLVRNFLITQKGKILIRKLETDSDPGILQESVVDCPFLC